MANTAQALPTKDRNLDGFLREIRALGRELEEGLCQADIDHARKIESWGRMATALGLATAWIAPNPISAIALSLGRSTRWIMMHHVGHKGYDKVPGVPAKYTSKVFARGARRFVDWADWMIPEAWIYEHNVLHHANTGELKDPDLVERNTEWMRSPKMPKAVRYALVGILGATWKMSYYAPSTLEAYRGRHEGAAEGASMTRDLFLKCYLPYAAIQFGLLPLAFLPLGPFASVNVLLNSLMAELLTNIHTLVVVGPNHTGDDLHRFDSRPSSRAEYYRRQVLGSTNYATGGVGGDLEDYAHLWLNYQIEHHLFPDLPMSKYQEAQPKVRAICEKYGIPYVQESVFTRFKKFVDVIVGNSEMLRS